MAYPTYTPHDWVTDELIDEADLDHIELGIKDLSDAVADIDVRLQGAGGTQTGEWTFNDTTSPPPAAGQIRLNNADQALATTVYISKTTAPGADAGSLLLQVTTDWVLYIQDKDDGSKWVEYDVTAPATDSGASVTVSVVLRGNGGTLPGGQRAMLAIKHPAGGGGGGGGGAIEYENAWSAAVAYQAGDVVKHNGIDYLAVNDSTGSTPPPAAWAPAPQAIAVVTALPASPVEGQEVILVDSLTAPTYQWHLRYLAAKASNRWIFIGGAPQYAEVTASEACSSTTYVAMTTPGPILVIPVAGDYLIDHGFRLSNNAAATWQAMSYDIGATPAVDADAAYASPGQGGASGSNHIQAMRRRRKTFAALTLTAKYRVSGGMSFADRWMSVTPVAVGG